MKFIKRIDQYELLPTGYGIAWEDVATRQSVCLPVPINWIVAVSRWVFFRLAYPHRLVSNTELSRELYAERRLRLQLERRVWHYAPDACDDIFQNEEIK